MVSSGGRPASGGNASPWNPTPALPEPGDGRQVTGGRSAAADAAVMDASVDASIVDGGTEDMDAGFDSGVFDPGTDGDGDFVISDYPVQPELTDQGAPRGRRFSFEMDSTKSVIFDGSDSTLNPAKPRSLSRRIDVYIPAAYEDGTDAPILVIQDGAGPIDLVSRALDNMTTTQDPARRIPAFIAIAVQNGGDDAQGSERGLEYDTMSDRYARFIQLEVLPAVLADSEIGAAYPQLRLTDDPEGRATLGCSSGAAAAFTMAWFRPDLFRRVVSYSGTFVAQQHNGQPEAVEYPLGAWEYHSSKALIQNTAPNRPVRVFLNVNENDLGAKTDESGHHNWVMANDRMAAAFKEKGYHYRYVFAKGRGHCDWGVQQATLADALAWVWAGYPN